MGSRSGGRAAGKSSQGTATADAEAAAVAETLLVRAQQYGMRTELTDWAKVGPAAARSQKTTAALARTVDDQPLRAIPPARR